MTLSWGTTHVLGEEGHTACGLRITNRRKGSVVAENPTCKNCSPNKYTNHAELAKTIYQDATTFLQECLVEGRPGVVYFNNKSRRKKHVVLVKDGEFWRRRKDGERASAATLPT